TSWTATPSTPSASRAPPCWSPTAFRSRSGPHPTRGWARTTARNGSRSSTSSPSRTSGEPRALTETDNMSKPIQTLVDQRPAGSLTTRCLSALDWVIPGQWHNLVGFENTIKAVSGEDDPELVQKIGERAIRLYNDPSQGYQRALWLYQTVDTGQGVLGAA